jgi:hypothetical protein
MIIGILTDPAVGGSFVTWSLHYLSGHTNYFFAPQNKFLPLPNDPLTDINAHIFKPNHPNTKDEFDLILNRLIKNQLTTFQTIYFHNLRTDTVNTQSHCNLTSEAVLNLQKETDKIIILNTAPKHSLYLSKFNGRHLTTKFIAEKGKNKNFFDQHQDFIDTFFKDSKEFWEKLNLSDIWDRREFLALNLRPYNTISILPNIDLTKKIYRLDSFDLYNQFDITVKDLFNSLNLNLNTARWENWILVYKRWQHIHSDRVLFVEYFDAIIESIINNYYLDLKRFNLDIVREATILHELLYKHNLSIKGWGLEKFPDNTQDLHKLLEKNTYHTLENIYGVL